VAPPYFGLWGVWACKFKAPARALKLNSPHVICRQPTRALHTTPHHPIMRRDRAPTPPAQVVSKRRKVCIDMLSSMQSELASELKQPVWEPPAWLPELQAKAKGALEGVRGTMLQTAPEVFNDDDFLASAFAGIVGARRTVSSWPEQLAFLCIEEAQKCARGESYHPASSSLIQPHPASSSLIQPHPASSSLIQPHPASSSLIQPHPASSSRIQPHPASSSLIQPHPAASSRIQPHPAASIHHPACPNHHQ
jgi:hypothetical protein